MLTYEDSQDPLIYLVTTPRRLLEAGCDGVFSDGNCTADITVIERALNLLGVGYRPPREVHAEHQKLQVAA